MSIGNQKEFFWKEKFFLLILTTFFLCKFSNQKLSPECVRYELHESSNSSDVIKSLISNCKIKTGYIEKHTVKLLSSWPILYNVTFECCSNRSCIQDIECPFNFNCDPKAGRCLVSDCELSDQLDHVLFEGTSCSIHDDCAFFVPLDFTNWKCVLGCADSIDGCATCQRCPNNSTSLSEPWTFNIDLSSSSPLESDSPSSSFDSSSSSFAFSSSSPSSSFSTLSPTLDDLTLDEVTATTIDPGTSRNDV